MINNSKFVSASVILANLARVHKNVQWNLDDIRNWSMQLETDMLADVDSMHVFSDIKLPVKNTQALLPCNVHRILDVYTRVDDPNSLIWYTNTGAYLNFKSSFTGTYVYITYYGTAIDEESGEPLILKTHVPACEAYCLKKAYYEPFLKGELDGQRWVILDRDVEDKCALAISQGIRFKDRSDLRNVNIIKGNMLSDLASKTLFNQGFSE